MAKKTVFAKSCIITSMRKDEVMDIAKNEKATDFECGMQYIPPCC